MCLLQDIQDDITTKEVCYDCHSNKGWTQESHGSYCCIMSFINLQKPPVHNKLPDVQTMTERQSLHCRLTNSFPWKHDHKKWTMRKGAGVHKQIMVWEGEWGLFCLQIGWEGPKTLSCCALIGLSSLSVLCLTTAQSMVLQLFLWLYLGLCMRKIDHNVTFSLNFVLRLWFRMTE